MICKTVGDLKKFLANLPDDMMLLGWPEEENLTDYHQHVEFRVINRTKEVEENKMQNPRDWQKVRDLWDDQEIPTKFVECDTTC